MLVRVYALLASCVFVASLVAQSGSELRLVLRNDPKTFDPALVDESSGETIRYLTGGVLVRLNRHTQTLEPELARSWKVAAGGRRLMLQLRQGVTFSDGTPFSAEDVAFTFQRLTDPNVHSPTGDSFRSGAGNMQVNVKSPSVLTIVFPTPVASIERLLDQVAIQSAKSPLKERAVLGPFTLAEYKPGSYVRLARNPRYWKTNHGKRLPYLDGIRFDIQANRDVEALRFRRGEIHMIDGLDPELFDQLRSQGGIKTANAGASTDVELLWFNQTGRGRLPAYKSQWFRLREFRQAISLAINRADMVRLVYRGYAQPSAGPVPATSPWFNTSLKPHAFQPAESLRRLKSAGFRFENSILKDSRGNAVVFSLITNSGNTIRSRLASMIQQDLRTIGITVNITAMDFASLLERIGSNFEYEACLLGLVNVDSDPNAQMNVWRSSSANHQWNPGQKKPATTWEAEIDQLMQDQATSVVDATRKRAFDRVQDIVSREVPFVYLVNRHALGAVASSVQGIVATTVRPTLLWNAEFLSLPGKGASDVRAAAGR